jgi:hypothetical protein
MLQDKTKSYGKGLLAALSLVTLGISLTGCIVAPGPRRVAYVAPAPIVVVHPYRIYVP